MENKIANLSTLQDIKHTLYEIRNIDNFDTMTEILTSVRSFDKALADTLTLITSDFNTQLNMQQKHFVVVIDQLISIEEKKILREIKIVNDDYLDHQDEIEDAEAQTQGHPQIVINTAAAAEPKTGDIFSLITEYKFVLSLVIFFILFLINKNALLSVLKALVEFTGIFKG
jgi:hypothetical protein